MRYTVSWNAASLAAPGRCARSAPEARRYGILPGAWRGCLRQRAAAAVPAPRVVPEDSEDAAHVRQRGPAGPRQFAETSAARSGLFRTTTAAPSERLTITVRECATTSCISRAMRFRSLTEARLAVLGRPRGNLLLVFAALAHPDADAGGDDV